MYDDTITFDRLEPNEQAVITAIRRWRDFPECAPCKILTREAREQIAVFISFLWRSDPFAVNIGVIFQQELPDLYPHFIWVLVVIIKRQPEECSEKVFYSPHF